MKTLKTLIVLGAFAGVLAGCQSTEQASTTPAGVKPYRLKTCIVSDEKLGSMGDTIVKVYDGQEVKFCCASCVKDFEKDKAKFMSKLK